MVNAGFMPCRRHGERLVAAMPTIRCKYAANDRQIRCIVPTVLSSLRVTMGMLRQDKKTPPGTRAGSCDFF
jgi:hypothetical protein